MAEEEEVIKISLQGAEDIIRAFQMIGEAAKKSTDDIGKGADKASPAIKRVEESTKAFVSSFRNVGSAAASFGNNVARVGTQAAKYFTILTGGIAAFNRYNAAQNQSTEDSKVALKELEQNSQAQIQYNQTLRQNAAALDDLGQAQRNANADAAQAVRDQIEDVDNAFRKQEIGQADRAKRIADIEEKSERDRARRATQQLREFAQLQERQQRELRLQQEAALSRRAEEEQRIRLTERLKAQQAAEKAYAANVKAFGSETAQGIDQFARAWDRLMDLLNQGPSTIADILKAAARFINDNGAEIVATFNRIGDAFAKALFGEGAGDPNAMAATIMNAFRGIASFVEDTVIPALGKVIKFFDTIAQAINRTFGTNITGATVAIVLIVGQLTGAFGVLAAIIGVVALGFKALFVIMAAAGFTPLGIAIRLVIAALVLLISTIAALNWQAMVDAAKSAVDSVAKFFSDLAGSIVKFFTDLWASVTNTTTNAWNGLLQFFAEAWESMKTMAQTAMAAVGNAILSAVPGLQTLIGWLGKAIEKFRQWQREAEGLSPSGGMQVQAAGGGPIFGPGTSTSDSIFAKLSTGEYVIRAAAVRKYGLRFLNAINNMRYGGGFSGGGLASFADAMFNPFQMPRFATGGVAATSGGSNKRPVIFQFADGAEFTGSFEDRTADRMGRYAQKRRMASSGRKASYFGSGR